MAEIWTGDILLPDNTEIKDITFASRDNASTLRIPASPLRFLAAVDTSHVPLYLAAGPSLDVWASSEDTQSWFESILLSKAASEVDAPESPSTAQPWWTHARSQSPIGILVSVDGDIKDEKNPRITEILFYGTIAAAADGTFPTPPSSSPEHGTPEILPELRVHALPLSSDLLYKPSAPTTGPASPSLNTSDASYPTEPQFLPSTFSLESTTTPSSPKRKRDVFEEAAQRRKKARRKGGESIAAAAAKTLDNKPSVTHRRSISIDGKAIPFADPRPGSAGAALSRPPSRPLSRSPSISSSDVRPLSRKGPQDTKRSNLSKVATVPVQAEEPTLETRNKEALSRVVLAAMRMHGLQQRKKTRSRRGSTAPGLETAEQKQGLNEEVAKEEAAKDEEYKLIYHQAYKGAAFALRQHITTSPLHLHPDRLRPLVEKLLDIFCADPLALPASPPNDPSGEVLATPANKGLLVPGSTQSRASPFDLPSGKGLAEARAKARQKEIEMGTVTGTGSPAARRKGGEGREVLTECLTECLTEVPNNGDAPGG
ncbi:uncharacterized protein EI97DRAFT_430235 [Westerdykella ornata]|uniref:Sld7 C-terminal domain-containing protein n=1 Tax=Westerdykella ornata TaxID=318751 RepID=A0A6A6JVB5_WESOR|nr:uncharacterized protein EI97DRAFT_430235 [Westerdykella ornata]KAF2280532.1 hypothetical protein EI97DRAFT_430235 [Westerdykella ornata]